MDQKEIQTTCVSGGACLFTVSQEYVEAMWLFFEQIPHPLTHLQRMWRGSGKLVWLALADWLTGWPGVTVGLLTKSCCFRTNQPADRGSHAACFCCESQIFLLPFFFSRQPLFWYQSGFKWFFFKAYSSSLASSAPTWKAQMLWMFFVFFLLEAIFCLWKERRRLIEWCLEVVLLSSSFNLGFRSVAASLI